MIDYNELPLVSIIVIHSREDWFDACIDSIEKSFYPKKEVIVIENMDKDKTIGKCWNIGVKKAKGDFCLFVGDDDAIMPDYIMSLILSYMDRMSKGFPVNGLTSMCMAINVDEGRMTPALMWVTGMWETDFLKSNPFDETLPNKVDYHWMNKVGKAHSQICTWNFGYIYRQHDGQVSGINLDKDAINYYDKCKERKTENS